MKNKNKSTIIILLLIAIIIVLSGYILYDGFLQKTKQNNNNLYELKSIYNAFDDSDTELIKAQKIVKEVEDAVNNKDWYYLGKILGNQADYYIKYGIYNYKVDKNNYQYIDGKYVFNEKFDWDKTKLNSLEDISLGTLLVIIFEDGGAIKIYTNSTGV